MRRSDSSFAFSADANFRLNNCRLKPVDDVVVAISSINCTYRLFVRALPGWLDVLRCVCLHGWGPSGLLVQVNAADCYCQLKAAAAIWHAIFSQLRSLVARRSSKEADDTAQVTGASDEQSRVGDEESGIQNQVRSSFAGGNDNQASYKELPSNGSPSKN